MESTAKPPPGTEGFVSRHRFILLFGVLMAFYCVTPLVQQLRERMHPVVPAAVEGVLFLALLVGTAVSVSKGRAWTLVTFLLAFPTAALWFAGAFLATGEVEIARHLLLVVFLCYVIGVMFRAIFDSQQVTFNTLCASLCIYLLLGLVWALAYSVVDVLDPAAFTYTVEAARHPPRLRLGRGDTAVLYFSFATLTTLGYGDIVPTSPISRMLASVEAVTGQLYLAVLVARLVGMHIVNATDQRLAQDNER
jgi:hypothetical protein